MAARKISEKSRSESCFDPKGHDIDARFDMDRCRLFCRDPSVAKFGDDLRQIYNGNGGRIGCRDQFMAGFSENQGKEG